MQAQAILEPEMAAVEEEVRLLLDQIREELGEQELVRAAVEAVDLAVTAPEVMEELLRVDRSSVEAVAVEQPLE